MFKLHEWHRGYKDYKLNKSTQTLYLNAGIIRDAGYELNFLSENGLKIVECERELINNITEAKINWNKKNEEKEILKHKIKLNLMSTQIISCQDVERYFARNKGKTTGMLEQANTNGDVLLDPWKRLKDVINIATFTLVEFNNIDKLGREVKSPVKKQVKAIGEYKDLRLLTCNLCQHLSVGIECNEAVYKFIQQSKQKLDLNKSKIITSIGKYIQQC